MIVVFLLITIDYFRNANSIVIIFVLQLLFSELLYNSSLLSSFRHTSAVTDPKVCNAKILLLVSGHQICYAI